MIRECYVLLVWITVTFNRNSEAAESVQENRISSDDECTVSTKSFECQVYGRFPDYSDRNCQKYFLCSLLHNGTFLKTPYECLRSTFDPKLRKCSSVYTCPCSLTTTTTTTSTVSPVTTKPPGECHISSEPFDCEKTGRFPDLSKGGCKNYFLCSLLHNGTFLKTPYKCQGGATFDPKLKKCSAEYTCPCDIIITTAQPPATCGAPNETFRCEKMGRFPDSSDPNCKKYFLCTLLHNGTMLRTLYKCQGGATFDPTLEKCSAEYVCPCSKPKPGCSIPSHDFECKVDGRFPNLFDMTCKDYFLCTKLRNGTFLKTPYTCQKSSFNPLLGKCTSKYLCPCKDDTTTTVSTIHTTTEGFTTAPAITTTIAYNCENSLGWVAPPFDCTIIGRYPDYSDSSCRRYFLCSQLRNGTFLKTPYRCPASSCINSSMQKCSSECICPCSRFEM